MNREALFSDGTKNYVMPPEPKKTRWSQLVSARQKMM